MRFIIGNYVLNFTTILGAQLGFEVVTMSDFESIDHPANWAFMLNLFALRITFTKFGDLSGLTND